MRKYIAMILSIGAFALLMVNQTMAYIFTSTGITVESADVTAVSGVSMNAVGSQYEILKFLGLFLLIGVATWILNKVLGIKIGGGSSSNG